LTDRSRERILRGPVDDGPGYIYAYSISKKPNEIKIGRSEDPQNRIQQQSYKSGHAPYNVLLTREVANIKLIEKTIHYQLENLKFEHPHGGDGYTEWFRGSWPAMEVEIFNVIEIGDRRWK